MACLFSKETAFGRMRGYRICNRWQETGVLRCPEGKCRLYKSDPHDTLLERRIEATIGAFCQGAADQCGDGDTNDPEAFGCVLPDGDPVERLKEIAMARDGQLSLF